MFSTKSFKLHTSHIYVMRREDEKTRNIFLTIDEEEKALDDIEKDRGK